jgi:hypothetical protein
LERNWLLAAHAVMLMFWAYMRPGEPLMLREEDVIPPSRASQCYAINLHSQDRFERSKVGVSDESLLLDMPALPWYGRMLSRLQTQGPRQPLLGIPYREVKRQFETAQLEIGFKRVSYVLYQARHGGPSHDRREKLRTMEEVKRRGRWESDRSLKRYEAHAKVQQEENAEGQAIQNQALTAMKNLQALFTSCTNRVLAKP